MPSAGRILIMPKGNWNAATEYEMLDLVYHNGTSWLSKKTHTGIEPTDANADYWQKLFDANSFIDTRIDEKVKEYMESNA